MQNLSFTPETQSTKASNGVHRHTQDPPPPPPQLVLFELLFITIANKGAIGL